MFEKIKKFYDMGLYTKEQVYKFAEKGVITEEEYKSIVEEETADGGEVTEWQKGALNYLKIEKYYTRRIKYGR